MRNVVILLAIAIAVLYLASLLYLYSQQRRLLVVGGGREAPIGDIYRVFT
jgi:hypothetical protein